MKWFDFAILILSGAAVLNAVRIIAAYHKKGKSMCGGQCAGCMHQCNAKRHMK